MKLSLRTLAILIGLVLVLGLHGRLLTEQMQQAAALADAQERLEQAESRLRRVRSGQDVAQLQEELDQARFKLYSAQALFPTTVRNVDLYGLVVRSAEQSGLQVLSINAAPPFDEVVGSSLYSAYLFDVSLKGDRSRLPQFLERLEKGPFGTLVVGQIGVSDGAGPWSASLQITVYGRSLGPAATPAPPPEEASPTAQPE